MLTLIIPFVLTLIILLVPTFRDWVCKLLGIDELESVWSKVGAALFGLLFIFFFLLSQVVVAPFIDPIEHPNMYVGKISSITPLQVPSTVYNYLLFIVLPLYMSKFIATLSPSAKNKVGLQTMGAMIGFFFVSIIYERLSVIELGTILVLYFILLQSQLISLDNFTSKSVLFILLLCFTLSSLHFIPGYKEIKDKVDGLIGHDANVGISQYLKHIVCYLLIPIIFARASASYLSLMKDGFGYGFMTGGLIGTILLRILPSDFFYPTKHHMLCGEQSCGIDFTE